MRSSRRAAVSAGLVILGIGIAIAATRVSFLQGDAPAGASRSDPAPEFAGISTWLNSPPLTVKALRGKIVLVDFWTYSCINCIRTFPALHALYDRYHDVGFEIVGVHSPEFTFEKNPSNVRAAIEEHGLTWPVAMDNDMDTWRAYKNHYWPHVYLIDARGIIRFDKIGEGDDDLVQTRIRALLAEAHATLPAPVDFNEDLPAGQITPEIYAGIDRGSFAGTIGNPEGYGRLGRVVDYKAVEPAAIADGNDGQFFLEGRWLASEEYIESSEDGAKLVLPFYARDVFFVAASSSPVEVRLMLDGKPVPAKVLGADAPAGAVRVSASDLYRLLHLTSPETHRLTLIADKGFRLFTFTFG
jgi:thiol-disulfide isomerase/thioredoxin